jgi:hypothetical protein
VSFVDKEKVDALIAAIKDKYLEMGMSVVGAGATVDDDGNLFIQTIALVRDSAYEQMIRDQETIRQFNQMTAAEHQRELDEKAQAISRAIEGGYVMDVMLGKRPLVECSHERIHEGLCLDCGKETNAQA